MSSKHVKHELQQPPEKPVMAEAGNHGVDAVFIVMAVVGAVLMLLFRKKKAPIAPQGMSTEEEIEQAIRTLERPRQLYAGRWFRHTIKMVECDAPASERQPPRIEHQMQQRANSR